MQAEMYLYDQTSTKVDDLGSSFINTPDDIKSTPQKISLIFETTADLSYERDLLTDLVDDKLSPFEEREVENEIVSQVEGVIDRIKLDTVRVRLKDVYVNFPIVLFSNISPLKQGQHVKYTIKKDSEGYRYQEILPLAITEAHPMKNEILEILNDIKLEDD